MADTVRDLAQRLGQQAEAVCRHYLSSGRREGGGTTRCTRICFCSNETVDGRWSRSASDTPI